MSKTAKKDKVAMIEKKVHDSKEIIKESFRRYKPEDLRIAWTGGKDSTLVAWLVLEACREEGIKVPRCFCINEGDMFEEVSQYLEEWKVKWNLDLDMIHNTNVSDLAGELGNEVEVDDLNERNKREVERLGWEDDSFTYEPESYVGNHLMKTVTCMVYLEDNKIQGFYEGIRWDEQGARAEEIPFSPRPATDFNPEHMRINPILHFTERDVWDAFIQYDIPICSLYQKGYRSLGAKITTKKVSDVPAWEQDLENTTERGGRRQDKEGLMNKLRDLGYM